MRTQANGYSFRDDRARRSQVWSPDVLPIWRRYAKLRTQLYPYISAASRTYQRTGLPIVRHLALAYPSDTAAARAQREFMFGPHLLAAPVVERGARTRSLRLPRGRWIDLWRSAAYDRRTGGLKLGRATDADRRARRQAARAARRAAAAGEGRGTARRCCHRTPTR